ncbi:hypothetical protein [Mycoplasmopsis adleri]|uniref:hypothetical protein n=1 Tax=Mycoplasmopsis adleri TaxID=51362 RepID=UPI003872CAC0
MIHTRKITFYKFILLFYCFTNYKKKLKEIIEEQNKKNQKYDILAKLLTAYNQNIIIKGSYSLIKQNVIFRAPNDLDFILNTFDESLKAKNDLIDTMINHLFDDYETGRKNTEIKKSWKLTYKSDSFLLETVVIEDIDNNSIIEIDNVKFTAIEHSFCSKFFQLLSNASGLNKKDPKDLIEDLECILNRFTKKDYPQLIKSFIKFLHSNIKFQILSFSWTPLDAYENIYKFVSNSKKILKCKKLLDFLYRTQNNDEIEFEVEKFKLIYAIRNYQFEIFKICQFEYGLDIKNYGNIFHIPIQMKEYFIKKMNGIKFIPENFLKLNPAQNFIEFEDSEYFYFNFMRFIDIYLRQSI